MSRIVAIGEPGAVSGFALAGVEVILAEGRDALTAAVAALEPEVGVVFLSARAQAALGDLQQDVAPGRPLWVVMPR